MVVYLHKLRSLRTMKISKLFLTLGALTVIGVSALGSKAYATSPGCTVDGTPLGKWGSTFTVRDGKITSNFAVKGEDCNITMSLVTWKAPAANGQPLYEQKLFDFKTKSL